MNIKNYTVRSIVVAFIEASVIISIIIFIGNPLHRKLNSAEKELREKRKKLEEVEELIKTIPYPEKEIQKIRNSIEELNSKSISQKELPRIIQQLIKKSSELNIEIVSIRPREDIIKTEKNLPQGVSKAYIEMVIKCPYYVLGDYLKALSELPIIFTVEDIHIEKVEEIETLSEKIDKKKRKKKVNDIFTTLLISTYTIVPI